MKKILLDTHAFLWCITGDERLSEKARQEFLDPDSDLYLSAASYWEICIKADLGKLRLVDGWDSIFDKEMTTNQIKWLPIDKEHSKGILALPLIHKDPFDRLLIAQALHEQMALLTKDENIHRYDVQALW